MVNDIGDLTDTGVANFCFHASEASLNTGDAAGFDWRGVGEFASCRTFPSELGSGGVSARARPSRALNGFGSEDKTRSSFTKSGRDVFQRNRSHGRGPLAGDFQSPSPRTGLARDSGPP